MAEMNMGPQQEDPEELSTALEVWGALPPHDKKKLSNCALAAVCVFFATWAVLHLAAGMVRPAACFWGCLASLTSTAVYARLLGGQTNNHKEDSPP